MLFCIEQVLNAGLSTFRFNTTCLSATNLRDSIKTVTKKQDSLKNRVTIRGVDWRVFRLISLSEKRKKKP
jgi:hypothetical protein